MCKVLIIPSVSNCEKEKLWQFVKLMKSEMTSYNNDGCGYSALTKDGKIVTERWLENYNAFDKRHKQRDNTKLKLLNNLVSIPEFSSDDKYNNSVISYDDNKFKGFKQFVGLEGGETSLDVKSIIFHTRKATCEKTIDNTHPFLWYIGSKNKEEIKYFSLIHNGVISNYNHLKKNYKPDSLYSTCDSEMILAEYLGFDCHTDPNNIKKMNESLSGYFACGLIGKNDDGFYVDVFKDERANLHCCYVNELNSYVFSTDAKDLGSVLTKLNWEYSDVVEVNGNKLIRFNSLTGEVLNQVDFETKIEKNENLNRGDITDFLDQTTLVEEIEERNSQQSIDIIDGCFNSKEDMAELQEAGFFSILLPDEYRNDEYKADLDYLVPNWFFDKSVNA